MVMLPLCIIAFAMGAVFFYFQGKKAGFKEGKALIPKELTDLIAQEQQEIAQEIIRRWRGTIRRKKR